MMGVWEVRIEHRRTYRSRSGYAIAFLMNDDDANKGCLPKAFVRAVDAVNKALNNKKEQKNEK